LVAAVEGNNCCFFFRIVKNVGTYEKPILKIRYVHFYRMLYSGQNPVPFEHDGVVVTNMLSQFSATWWDLKLQTQWSIIVVRAIQL
jgi:hypothetical protein